MTDKTPNEAEPSVDPSTVSEDAALEPAGDMLADELPDPARFDVADDEAEELDPATSKDDPEQTADAEATAVAAASTKPVKRKTSPAPVKKAAPTPKRSDKAHEAHDDQRVGPITFTKQSVGELKKVNWPTGEQMRQYFFAVLLFVLFIIAFVGLLDLGFVAGLLKLFG